MLEKKNTAVVTAIKIFDILDHIHCWQLCIFSYSKSGRMKPWMKKLGVYVYTFFKINNKVLGVNGARE